MLGEFIRLVLGVWGYMLVAVICSALIAHTLEESLERHYGVLGTSRYIGQFIFFSLLLAFSLLAVWVFI